MGESRRRAAARVALLLITACYGPADRSAAPGPPDTADLGRARAAADDLGRDLMGLLAAELGRGGPAAAVAVCADSAQQRTARHQAEGLQVRRVGTRIRNPANTPDGIELAVLEAYARAIETGRSPGDTAFLLVSRDGTRELRFLRPIRVTEPCLACHGSGDRRSPQVQAILAARYPEDRAVDYRPGDLRGAISVRMRAPADTKRGER